MFWYGTKCNLLNSNLTFQPLIAACKVVAALFSLNLSLPAILLPIKPLNAVCKVVAALFSLSAF